MIRRAPPTLVIRAIAALLSPALLCGCIEFSPPVREEVGLRFLPDGSVEVCAETLLADPRTSFQTHERAKVRIEEVQDDALALRDPWSRRFARLEWARDTLLWERTCGHLVRVRREGVLTDPARLSEVMRDLPVTVSFQRQDGEAELAIVPQSPSAATQAQRDALAAFLESWIPQLRAYLQAEADLYAYLDAHPGRPRACFATVFEGCTAGGEADAAEEPQGEEKVLLDRLGESMGKVIEVIEVRKEDAFSPDELSRLCHDALPAPLSVEVPGPILASEGFESAGPARLVHRGKSLWSAVESIAERWVSPDVLVPAVSCLLREGAEKRLVDVNAFGARPRAFTDLPSEEELLRAVEEALGPEPVYRVRWREAAPQKGRDGG